MQALGGLVLARRVSFALLLHLHSHIAHLLHLHSHIALLLHLHSHMALIYYSNTCYPHLQAENPDTLNLIKERENLLQAR